MSRVRMFILLSPPAATAAAATATAATAATTPATPTAATTTAAPPTAPSPAAAPTASAAVVAVEAARLIADLFVPRGARVAALELLLRRRVAVSDVPAMLGVVLPAALPPLLVDRPAPVDVLRLVDVHVGVGIPAVV